MSPNVLTNAYQLYFLGFDGRDYVKLNGTNSGSDPKSTLLRHAEAGRTGGFTEWLVQDTRTGDIYGYTLTKGGWNATEHRAHRQRIS